MKDVIYAKANIDGSVIRLAFHVLKIEKGGKRIPTPPKTAIGPTGYESERTEYTATTMINGIIINEDIGKIFKSLEVFVGTEGILYLDTKDTLGLSTLVKTEKSSALSLKNPDAEIKEIGKLSINHVKMSMIPEVDEFLECILNLYIFKDKTDIGYSSYIDPILWNPITRDKELRERFLFMESDDNKKEYHLLNYKDEMLVPIAKFSSTLSVVRVKERYKLINELRDSIRSSFDGIILPLRFNLDYLFNKRFVWLYRAFGSVIFKTEKRGDNDYVIKTTHHRPGNVKEDIDLDPVETVTPPGLLLERLKRERIYSSIIDSYIEFKKGKGIKGLKFIDVTDNFLENNTWRFERDDEVVKLSIMNLPLPIVLGAHTPSRNIIRANLTKKHKNKVHICLYKRDGDVEVLFIMDNNESIYLSTSGDTNIVFGKLHEKLIKLI